MLTCMKLNAVDNFFMTAAVCLCLSLRNSDILILKCHKEIQAEYDILKVWLKDNAPKHVMDWTRSYVRS